MFEEINQEAQENKENQETQESRREAIAKGLDEVDKNLNLNQETKDQKESKFKDGEAEEESKEYSEEEISNALKLYQAINDPNAGPAIIKTLAESLGLTKDSTKEEVKEVKKSVKDLTKEVLGTEYAFLADKLGEVLEKVIPEVTKEAHARIDNQERQVLAERIDKAWNEVFGQYDEIPKPTMQRFNALLDEMPPIPGKTDPKIYFNRLIKIAAEETNYTLKKSSSSSSKNQEKENKNLQEIIKDRVARNKRDATSHLASKGVAGEVSETSRQSSPPKSRREAVERAVNDLEASIKG